MRITIAVLRSYSRLTARASSATEADNVAEQSTAAASVLRASLPGDQEFSAMQASSRRAYRNPRAYSVDTNLTDETPWCLSSAAAARPANNLHVAGSTNPKSPVRVGGLRPVAAALLAPPPPRPLSTPAGMHAPTPASHRRAAAAALSQREATVLALIISIDRLSTRRAS